MTYYPDIHHRRSIRLDGYDYSQKGAYYITICTHNRACLFGEIHVGAGPCACPELILNNAGKMIEVVWNEIPEYYPGYTIDEYIIMPNHIHGIICNVGAGPRACPDFLQRQLPFSVLVHVGKIVLLSAGIKIIQYDPYRQYQ